MPIMSRAPTVLRPCTLTEPPLDTPVAGEPLEEAWT
jgi:hypothetical protein